MPRELTEQFWHNGWLASECATTRILPDINTHSGAAKTSPHPEDFAPPTRPLDGDGRRSIYLNVRRNFLSPFFLAFDFPTPFTTMGKRSSSNVPAQALALMNNPLVVQQTAKWAETVGTATNDPNARITRLYREAYSRPPTETELNAAHTFLAAQAQEYGSPNDPRA